jgi:maltose O-acetyltransferase
VFRKVLGRRGRVAAWQALGADIAHDVVLSARVTMRRPEHVAIGSGSRLNNRIWLDSWGQITIGSNVQMNGDIDLYSAGHDVDSPVLAEDIRSIDVGDYCWLAHHVVVLPGRRIGRFAVIGTGSVVAHDVPEYGVAVGNPARVVKHRARVDYTYRPSEFP